MSDINFKQILKDAGMPTTREALNAQWKTDVVASGSTINNDSAYSPFWKVINALITQPALWLIEFLANTVMPNAFVKYASGTFLEVLADGVNLTRKGAVAAQGEVTFSRSNVGQGVTIAAGTLIQTASLNGAVYQLITTAEASFDSGLSTLRVPVQAVEAGEVFNLAAGYYSILPTPIANISAVENTADWLSLPGANIETDDDLRARVRNQFGSSSDFHSDAVYTALISTFPGVTVDAIWFEHDAPRGPGTANAFVLFDFAAPVSQYLADINKHITDDGHHGHGDDLLVFQMPEQNQALTATVYHDNTLLADDITALQTQVDDFISAAFRENTLYSPSQTYPHNRFSFSRLGQELHAAFNGIHSVDFNLDDIVSQLWVARLSSLTVTMQATE